MSEIKVKNVERITINGDPNKILEFDPTDITFVERFYQFYREFDEKHAEYLQRVGHLQELLPRLQEYILLR